MPEAENPSLAHLLSVDGSEKIFGQVISEYKADGNLIGFTFQGEYPERLRNQAPPPSCHGSATASQTGSACPFYADSSALGGRRRLVEYLHVLGIRIILSHELRQLIRWETLINHVGPGKSQRLGKQISRHPYWVLGILRATLLLVPLIVRKH